MHFSVILGAFAGLTTFAFAAPTRNGLENRDIDSSGELLKRQSYPTIVRCVFCREEDTKVVEAYVRALRDGGLTLEQREVISDIVARDAEAGGDYAVVDKRSCSLCRDEEIQTINAIARMTRGGKINHEERAILNGLINI